MPDNRKFLGVSLKFDEQLIYVEGDEPGRFVQHFTGEVQVWNQNVDDLRAGWFRAIFMDIVSTIDEDYSVFDMFDYDATTFDYYSDLYEANGEVRGNVMHLIYGRHGWKWAPNLLILDRLEILPEHRGKGIGLIALWGLIRWAGVGAGIVAMKPFPLQCEPKPDNETWRARWNALQLDALPKDHDEAAAKLRRYYKRLGFKLLPGSDIMVRSALTELPALTSLYRR